MSLQPAAVWRERPRAVVALGVVAYGVLTLLQHQRVGSWVATQWLFDYDDGFLRRGLVGTLIGSVSAIEVQRWAMLVSLVLVVAAAVLVAVVVTRGGGVDQQRLAVAAAALGSAGGLPFIAASSGRLEQVALLLAVPTAVAVWHSRLGVLVAVATGALAALVHEGSVLLFWPWLAALSWHRHRGVPDALVAVGLPVLAAVAVTSLGSPVVLQEEFLAQLAVGTDIEPSAASVASIYNDLEDSLRKSHATLTSLRGLRLPMSILAAAPLLGYGLWAAWPAWRSHRLLLAASLFPIALTVVAVDYGRWFGIAAVLVTVSAMVIGPRRPLRHLLVGAAGVLLASTASGPTDDWGFQGMTDYLTPLLEAVLH